MDFVLLCTQTDDCVPQKLPASCATAGVESAHGARGQKIARLIYARLSPNFKPLSGRTLSMGGTTRLSCPCSRGSLASDRFQRQSAKKIALSIRAIRVSTSWVKRNSPLRHAPGVVKAMDTRQAQVMYVRAAGLMRHRRLDLGASRMVPEPGAVALGNQPCAGVGWCGAWRRLREARSGKDSNEASKNK